MMMMIWLVKSLTYVSVEQRSDTAPGVIWTSLHYPASGAVIGQAEVDDAGDDEETDVDAEVVGGELIFCSETF